VSGRPTLGQALSRDHALSRNVLLFVALAGTIGSIAAGLDHPRAWWLLLLFVPLLLITVIDLAQTHHSLRRNYPGSARLRWFFEWLRPFLRSYIVESDLDGRPFSHDERALVYARAKGDVSTHPFGTELDVYSEEYEWLAHSMAPTRQAERYTRVTVGTDQCSKPYQAARLNISAMSFGALSANAIEALNLGAKIGGFYHDTGEGGLSPTISSMVATWCGKSVRAILAAATPREFPSRAFSRTRRARCRGDDRDQAQPRRQARTWRLASRCQGHRGNRQDP
jgi:glutamate synthase domain-containing protein 2